MGLPISHYLCLLGGSVRTSGSPQQSHPSSQALPSYIWAMVLDFHALDHGILTCHLYQWTAHADPCLLPLSSVQHHHRLERNPDAFQSHGRASDQESELKDSKNVQRKRHRHRGVRHLETSKRRANQDFLGQELQRKALFLEDASWSFHDFQLVPDDRPNWSYQPFQVLPRLLDLPSLQIDGRPSLCGGLIINSTIPNGNWKILSPHHSTNCPDCPRSCNRLNLLHLQAGPEKPSQP